MEQNNNTIIDLKRKEKEIYQELQTLNLFKQWESLKSTIGLFENINTVQRATKENIPTEYATTLTWGDKVLFAVNRIEEGFVPDIADELLKFEPGMDKETIIKRISGMVSLLIDRDRLRVLKKVGRKNKLGLK